MATHYAVHLPFSSVCFSKYPALLYAFPVTNLFNSFLQVDCVWNVMSHAQKPEFVFRRNRRVHLNRRKASVHSTTGNWGVHISGSNAGYTMFRGSVKGTGYPLHSPVSPSLPLPCVNVCHHISTGLYQYVVGSQERKMGCSRSHQVFPVPHWRGEIFKHRLFSAAHE